MASQPDNLSNAERITKSANEFNAYIAALIPIDQAFAASEARWGVGRLERLVRSELLQAYQRGWGIYRAALEAQDAEAVAAVGPKMVTMLALMDQDALAQGHAPLAVTSWEVGLADGTVLTVVRTLPEAHALAKASDSRYRRVYTLAEVARILIACEAFPPASESQEGASVHAGAGEAAIELPGDLVQSGVQLTEGEAVDWATGVGI